jgi:hypothetical protein
MDITGSQHLGRLSACGKPLFHPDEFNRRGLGFRCDAHAFCFTKETLIYYGINPTLLRGFGKTQSKNQALKMRTKKNLKHRDVSGF